MQRGRLLPQVARNVAARLATALGEAHAAGRIHGNLTSDSIRLQGEEEEVQVLIAGFGETPTSAGNLDHLAPERRAGGPPSIAADIYSFGHILEQLKHATKLDSASGLAWDQAVVRCLDPLPERRFASVSSAVEAIDLTGATLSRSVIAASIEGPKKWGEFQLLQRLGAGAFGEVYRAWDPILEREVALKLLLPRGLDPEQEYAAILSEARAIARLRHPNIVPVYGVDRRDGRVGYWSDFVRGQTLSDVVASQGPLSARATAETGIALCNALTAVHHAGLLHRDIKASNAMRDESGGTLLMDFGLSQELHRAVGMSGTPDYMAPELLTGEAATVQSDIYAMGVLLLFLCTGRYPLTQHSKPANATEPLIAPALQAVIRSATASAPQERPQSAAKLRDALAATLIATPASASGNSPVTRRRKLWIVAGVVILCVTAGLLPQVRREARAKFAGTNPAAYQDFLAAEDALQRYDKPGNTEKAIALYRQTLQRSPSFALAEAGLARADWRMYVDTSDAKWVDQASRDGASAAAMNPNLAPVQMTLGVIHIEQGKSGLGMQELGEAEKLDPRSADAHAALGEAYRQQGRIAEAKTELQSAIDLAPDNWRWPYLLGALQIDTGDFKSAEASLRAALDKTPDNARILYDLGLVYRKQDRLPEARGVFEQALKLDPRIETIMALGTVLVLQGDYDGALEMYKRAAATSPGAWEVWGNLAAAWQWTGRDPAEVARNYSKAIALAREEMKTTPDDPYLVSMVGSYYAYLGDSRQALPLLRKSMLVAPSDPDVLERVAESYETLGDRTKAIELLTKSLQLGFSPNYAKKTPAFHALRQDPRAPEQVRDTTNPHP